MTTKRINFDVTPEQEAELSRLRELLQAPSNKETVLRALRVTAHLAHALQEGGALYVHHRGERVRVLLPDLESPDHALQYLVRRPHPWRREPWFKGRRLRASTVWRDMHANEMTIAEAADNWGLPVEAIHEATQWCEDHQALLQMEADEERRRLADGGVDIGARATG